MILAIWLSVHWDWRLLVWIVVSFGSVGCTLVNSLALRIWDGFLWFGSVYLVILSSFLFIIDSFGSVFSVRFSANFDSFSARLSAWFFWLFC